MKRRKKKFEGRGGESKVRSLQEFRGPTCNGKADDRNCYYVSRKYVPHFEKLRRALYTYVCMCVRACTRVIYMYRESEREGEGERERNKKIRNIRAESIIETEKIKGKNKTRIEDACAHTHKIALYIIVGIT